MGRPPCPLLSFEGWRAPKDCVASDIMNLPPGVRVLPEFVSSLEEEDVLASLLLAGADAPSSPVWEGLAGRRVAHFGARFDYASRAVGGAAPPLPKAAAAVAARAAAAAGFAGGGSSATPPSLQATANDYPPGSGIHWHVDTHSPFGPTIAVLSFGSGARLDLRQPAGGGTCRGGNGGTVACWRRAGVWLPPRSLLVLEGEARHGWEHAIIARKTDPHPDGRVDGEGNPLATLRRARRVSLTLRTLRPPGPGPPCACAWPTLCDAQGGGLGPTRDALRKAAYQGSEAHAQSAGGPAAVAAAAAVQREVVVVGAAAAPPLSSSSLAAAAAAAAATAAANPADLAAAEAAAVTGLAALRAEEDGQKGGEGEAPATSRPSPAAPPSFERALVRAVYDRIAPHFAGTRVALWPQVTEFVAARGPTALILDVGCGNGKYLSLAAPAAGCAVLAGEPCRALAAAASASGPPGRAGCIVVSDGLDPVWRAGVADGVLCVAVVHHLASPGRRAALVARCARALAPGGRALITAWARPDTQPAGKDAARAGRWRPLAGGGPGDFLVPGHVPPGWGGGAGAAGGAPAPLPPPARPPMRGKGPGGMLTPDQRAVQSELDRARQPPPAAWRFYHCFTGEELEGEAAAGVAAAGEEAARAGEARVSYEVVRVFLDRGNWCVEVGRRDGEMEAVSMG